MTGLLDRLPAPVRHAVLVFVGAFVTTLLGVVSANVHDLSAIVWGTVLLDALSAGVASAIAAVGLAAATPLTTQYGVGAGTPTVGAHEATDPAPTPVVTSTTEGTDLGQTPPVV